MNFKSAKAGQNNEVFSFIPSLPRFLWPNWKNPRGDPSVHPLAVTACVGRLQCLPDLLMISNSSKHIKGVDGGG